MRPDGQIEQVRQHIQATAAIPIVAADAIQAVAWFDLGQPLASVIDHTLLKPEATPQQIDQLCREALQYGFASVCVNPVYVTQCAHMLNGSSVLVCTVVGFPLGATTTGAKVFETCQAIDNGAREIDMVLAVGRLKAGDYAAVLDDITHVVAACHAQAAVCKVILETALLTDDEKIAACLLAAHAGADFVKTSTGFAASGATIDDILLMRQVVGAARGVKAAGGIRTRQAALAMLDAGASRIGASASVQLVNEA